MDDKIKQYKETLSLEKQSPTQVGLLRKGERHLNLRRLPFAADGAIQMSFDVARLARFERAAFRLGGERSILLSYRRVCLLIKAYVLYPRTRLVSINS